MMESNRVRKVVAISSHGKPVPILVTWFVNETTPSMCTQLEQDAIRWGDTYLKRARKGQEWRIFKTFMRYFFNYFFKRQPIPWLKIIGNAHIALCREKHPEVWKE